MGRGVPGLFIHIVPPFTLSPPPPPGVRGGPALQRHQVLVPPKISRGFNLYLESSERQQREILEGLETKRKTRSLKEDMG